jgi:hypothetical protein
MSYDTNARRTHPLFLVNDETKTVLYRGIVNSLGVHAGIYILLCELAKVSQVLVPVDKSAHEPWPKKHLYHLCDWQGLVRDPTATMIFIGEGLMAPVVLRE